MPPNALAVSRAPVLESDMLLLIRGCKVGALSSCPLECFRLQFYCCFVCRNYVAQHDDIVSKSFQAQTGRAFLFSHTMNVIVGAKEDRHLITGFHTVADVFCFDCGEALGWEYFLAYEESQMYKGAKLCSRSIRLSRTIGFFPTKPSEIEFLLPIGHISLEKVLRLLAAGKQKPNQLGQELMGRKMVMRI
ncbi:hypothetical protein Nepgr_024372 [Nepenthes gracilis]|uniref:Yippee domain-containing protein n=1 Tax=Nepenthes gracilis TaxID=150966 RepID=A0AAD3XZZ0_NEPGR|nr:hypothetical protein Nepgr_024372 [Nepenthes gracilis]